MALHAAHPAHVSVSRIAVEGCPVWYRFTYTGNAAAYTVAPRPCGSQILVSPSLKQTDQSVSPKSSKPQSREEPVAPPAPEVERAVGVTAPELTALYVLNGIRGFGPQKFKQLYEEGTSPASVIHNPSALTLGGKRGEQLRSLIATHVATLLPECRARAARQIATAHKLGALILTYRSKHYPPNVFASNNPLPILYARGAPAVLETTNVVACVGSRAIRPPYAALQAQFARTACSSGFAVVSGFALGADTIAHKAAHDAGGKTICCMPGGLDRPFPPENRSLWEHFLKYPGAVLVSEFPFGTAASALTLRKRNKLIVAFAHGVLVAQSSAKGGAMNAFRFALEQKKPLATFAADSMPDTSGNALIAATGGPQDVVFATHTTDSEMYQRWLLRLSSST